MLAPVFILVTRLFPAQAKGSAVARVGLWASAAIVLIVIATLGTAGPAVTAGVLLLMYKLALAMVIGLGPIFIMCLIFEQTKDLFKRWLLYGIGTLFSFAVLNFMLSIALDLCLRVAAALWATNVINSITGQGSGGFSSQAMQQGGVGLLMTLLIITTPAMAAAFFQGTLGQFSPYSTVGASSGHPGPQGQPPGAYSGGYAPPSHPSTPSSPQANMPDWGQHQATPQPLAGKYLDAGTTITPTDGNRLT